MSNNPFLRNNNNNNRFNLLNDDIDVPSVKNYTQVKNYTPVNDKKTFNENRGRNRDNNRYTNKIDDNRFKSIIPEQPKLDVDNIKAFPILVNTKECDKIIHTSSNFKDILNNVIEENTIEHRDIILPGWLKLTMLNGKVLKEEQKKGEEAEAEVKAEETDETDEAENQIELNYNMYKIGNALQTNYELYEKEYDSINGEGSYDKNFRLSPVYGSEYDSNSESENNDEHDNDDEYEYEN